MRLPLLATLAALALTACGKGEQQTPDSSAAAATPAPAAQATSAPAPSPGQGDKAFLEQMSDHHEAMVQMAYTTRGKISEAETRKDADALHEKQSVERDSMVAMLKRDFSESYTPKVPASNQAMVDSIGKLRGRALAVGFYQMTVQHHKEGVAMIEQFLPSLANPQVKQMAEKMKADQQKEIADFERKAPTKAASDPHAEGHESH